MSESIAGLEWLDWLSIPRKLVAISHMNPDGDAIGSCLGLKHLLEPLSHQVSVLMPTQSPRYMNWAPGFGSILHADNQFEECSRLIEEAEGIFCLDFGVLDRTKSLEAAIRRATGIVFNIDHHIDTEPFAHFAIYDTEASSTCELVYRMGKQLEHRLERRLFSSASATCLYAGLSTDTGSFRHRNTNSRTHRVAADLVELGASVEEINFGLYARQSESKLRLMGFCLQERLRVLPELHTALISLPAIDYERFQVEPGDTEGLVNLALSVEGVNLGVLLVERPDNIRLSFRSLGSFPANKLAAHFGGGGHFNAAGARSTDSLQVTEFRLLELLLSYRSLLDYQPF